MKSTAKVLEKRTKKSNIQFLLITSAFSHPTICYLIAGQSISELQKEVKSLWSDRKEKST